MNPYAYESGLVTFDDMLLDPLPGRLYRVDTRRRPWQLASAEVARVRLRRVVAADRAAVPCGQWRKVRDARDSLYMMGAAIAAGHKAIVTGDWRWFDSLNRTLRPRYRWTVRR